MPMLRLYQNGTLEFVVICTDTEGADEDYEGNALIEEKEIEGDFSSWPTDRPLISRA